MKRTSFLSKLVAVAALAAAFAMPAAFSATPNIAVGAGQEQVIVLPLSGTYSATTAAVVKFNMPFPCQILGIGATSRALTGSSNTVDVLVAGSSVLSAAIPITAGTYTQGTVTTAAIADEAAVTVNLTIPAGTLVDTTVALTCARK